MGDDPGVAMSAIVGELGRIHGIKKRTGCECFLGVVQTLEQQVSAGEVPVGSSPAPRLRHWLEYGRRRRHNCLRCRVCLPAELYNQFMAMCKLQPHEGGAEVQVLR